MGRIASPTSLEFLRATNATPPAPPIEIRWHVVEFASGVSVQRGQTVQTGAVIDVPITPVGSLNQAFTTWSKLPGATDQNLNDDDALLGELTAVDNLQFRVSRANSQKSMWWQVIEYTDPADINVQKGTTSLMSGALSVDVTLASPVSLNTTFVLAAFRTSGGGADIGARMIRAQLIDSTTIRLDRALAGNSDDLDEIVWQAVELRDGSFVQRGSASFGAAAQSIVPLGSPVDTSRSIAFASVQPVGGQNMGRSDYGGDDVIGVCSVTAAVAANQITMDRSSTAGSCDVGWFAVQFSNTPTAVDLVSFKASAADSKVVLQWETGSEINNLGFHLYRSVSPSGPYERVTDRAIPGLGSSPSGASYTYVDRSVSNGATYYYELEDVDTSGRTERHGPVSATPFAGSASVDDDDVASSVTYGEPAASGFRIVPKNNGVVLELDTGGFVAIPREDGSVVVEVPGLEELPGSSLPVKRAWVEALAGRDVKVLSVKARYLERFSGLRPSASVVSELEASPNGTVRARLLRRGRRQLQREGATLVETAYQGETKKALFELSPFAWDGSGLVLAKKLEVHVAFRGREVLVRRGGRKGSASLRLVTTERGLYAVPLDEILGRRGRRFRLSRQGESVAHHVEDGVLYFWSEGASENPYGTEAVYELELGAAGDAMEVTSGTGTDPFYWHAVEREENRYYQAGLVNAPDVWLWELLFAPARKSFVFDVSALASETSRLEVWLQGTSDFAGVEDHHVQVYVNGSFVGESRWDGKTAHKLEAGLAAGILHEGENVVELESVGDTGALYSMVMLDRFRVRYPRQVSVLESSRYVLDVSAETPTWVASRRGFDAELAYVAVDETVRPEVRSVARTKLRQRRRADYLVIGPEAFLDTAKPLLRHRRREGLRVVTASTEAIASEFGYGELTPESIRDYIAYAYREARGRKPRYVLLLGDATYDYKDYLATGVTNQVPPYMVRTSYLWTASDPTYAAVNGDDGLPDLAIGRLPAASVEELQVMIDKILELETSGRWLDGRVVLVADDPDEAGNFEADAKELAATVLSSKEVQTILLGELGASSGRDAVRAAFDQGSSLMSYIGHGGIHLWADENVLNIDDVAHLASQNDQPILLTINCLNGYFHFPYFDALSEALLKAEGKGVVAAFSPSGLSLNDAAHRYHRLLLEEILSGNHARLGDAVLAGQLGYAEIGVFPEALLIYHLLGDPALRIH